MFKFVRKITVFTIALFIGLAIVASPAAEADLPDPVPAECQIYVDQKEAYLMAVIGNYQDALAYEKTQTQMWHDAHDRVAANAVERNYEYAAEVEKNRKLTDKVNWKNAKLRELRGIIRDLRSK